MLKKVLKFSILPVLVFPLFASPLSCDFLADDAGVFASYDRGQNWEQKGQIDKDRSLNKESVLSLSFDAGDPRIIYVGTEKGGLFKTLDGGDLWYLVEDRNGVLSEDFSVYDIAIDQRDSNRVYLAALTDSYGRCFRSEDGGASWQEVYKTSQTGKIASAVLINPADSSLVYMGTAEGGLLLSQDYGKSWKALQWFNSPISDIAIHPLSSSTVLVSTAGGGIFRSADGGQTWQKLTAGENNIEELRPMNSSGASFLAASPSGLFKTSDQGETWERVNIVIPPDSLPIISSAINPQNSREFYYGAGSVIYKTSDGGENWEVFPLPTTKEASVIEINPHFAENVLAGIRK